MVKLHCDKCDKVIDDTESRTSIKHYQGKSDNERPDVYIVVCTHCAELMTLKDLVNCFVRRKF